MFDEVRTTLFSRQREWFAVERQRHMVGIWKSANTYTELNHFSRCVFLGVNMESKYKENTIRHWYISDFEYEDKIYQVVRGTFYNRPGFYEGLHTRTSPIQEVKVSMEEQEYEITTMNTVYHCSFDSCFFERQDKSSFELPEYQQIRQKFFVSTETSTLSNDDMLLVVADFEDYFFKDLIYFDKSGNQEKYLNNVHLGMVVDTYLITSKDYKVDIRWYVYDCGFKFYSLETGNRNLWIENVGDTSLRIVMGDNVINLEANTREKVLMKK